MAQTGYFTDPLFLQHDTGPHPERPQRLEAIHRHLQETGLLGHLTPLSAQNAPREAVDAVHDPTHLDTIAAICERGGGHLDGDTPTSPQSFNAALRASGAAMRAADLVMAGELTNAFVAGRPPGHHATAGQAMGFCLVNHVAVLARYLQRQHGLKRVLIVDFDVHHGNGTQDIFYADDTVMYVSSHQAGAYPGTGHAAERGRGKGEGYTRNIPLRPGSGDEEVLKVYHDTVLMEGLEFMPDFVLVSAGFDAHARDPLAGLNFSSEVFGELTRILQVIAYNSCEGRLISLLEGGYDLVGLSEGVEHHLRALKEFEPQAH